MSARAVAEPRPEATAANLSLGSTAALLFAARSVQYLVFGITGILLARGLGPDGRGVYGLINETAIIASSFPGMGLEMAGIYLFGQSRFRLQTVFSNSFSWTVCLSVIWMALIGVAIVTDENILGMETLDLCIALAGACLIMITDGAGEYLLPLGRVRAYTSLKIIVPVVRLAGILVMALAVGLSVEVAAAIWLGSFAVGAVITVFFLLRHVRVLPGINMAALKQQASFGVRGHFGWVLQALNHRLDVFLVGYFVGTAGVGHYLVGVNLAELGWWIPITLGTVLFPKVAAMQSKDNFELSAAACRRTLAVTGAAMIGLLILARPMIPIVYGTEFGPSVSVFLILLPSGLFYTLHKVLGSSLSANGMPQVTVFSGLASLPVTIGLNLVLVPAWGIQGAAVASDVAYAINAAVVLGFFLKVSKLPLRDVLFFNGEDISAFRWTVRDLWTNYVRRNAAYQPTVSE